jgi:predicted dehydrogenase
MTSFPRNSKLPIAVIGAGAIGRSHIERALQHAEVQPVAIVDPSPEAQAFGTSLNIPWYPDHRIMLAECRIGGAVVSTPNSTHADIGIACLDAGVPVLMEKPVAESVEQAQRLCERREQLGIPLMVGHQRRHNPILRRARELIANGAIGRPVSATAMAVWLKPDSYFEPAWRRETGGGPVLLNLVHDIDSLRFLLGDVTSVQATASNAVRGFEVEDTAAVMLTFANGLIASMSVSDTAVSPWNWDLAAGESAYFVQQDVNSYFFCGTEGSLALPRLDLWRYDGARGWRDPLTQARTALHRVDPYMEQLRHFRAVIEGTEVPLCSGRDGLRTLEVTLAVQIAADTRKPVSLSPLSTLPRPTR